MNWADIKIDTTVNLEGLIAAIAILGAVIGFILNLIRNWREDSKKKRYRGTNSIILDLLEQYFKEGLSEKKLWELYKSDETLQKRKQFKAWKPKKLGAIGFEGQLKHLQSNFLIRLTGPAHYHIDFSRADDWARYSIKNKFQNAMEKVKQTIGEDRLNEIINSALIGDKISSYQKKDVYRYLLKAGGENGVNQLISQLQSEDENIRKDAVELFIEINRELF